MNKKIGFQKSVAQKLVLKSLKINSFLRPNFISSRIFTENFTENFCAQKIVFNFFFPIMKKSPGKVHVF